MSAVDDLRDDLLHREGGQSNVEMVAATLERMAAELRKAAPARTVIDLAKERARRRGGSS